MFSRICILCFFSFCILFLHMRYLCIHHFAVVKQLLIYEEQFFAWRREEHSGNVLCALVVLHSEELRSPSEVFLLREFRLASEGDVIALVG